MPGWPIHPGTLTHGSGLHSSLLCASRSFRASHTMIRPFPALLFVSLAMLAGAAQAENIWKWRDANGIMQFSDQPPPHWVPAKDIVGRPGAQRTSIVVADAAASAPETAGSAPARADAELEARKKKMQADKAAADTDRRLADKARTDALKADNCKRAKAQLAMLESGVRVARPNEKGEREFLDDKARADEVNRTRAAVTDNCQ